MKVIASKLQPEGACTYFVHGDKLFGFERFVSLDQARTYAERANAALDAHDAALLADYRDALRQRDEAIACLKSELAEAEKKYEAVSELADGRWKCTVSYMRQRDEARAKVAELEERLANTLRDPSSSFVFDDFGASRIVNGAPEAIHGLAIKFARLRVLEQQAVSERARADKATEKYTRVREAVKKIADGGF